MIASLIRRLLAHPLTAGVDLDDPATTDLRRQIIASKPFLRAIYAEWYSLLGAALPAGDGAVLELGSGAGHCARFIPGLISSDVCASPGMLMVVQAARLPFAGNSLRAIVMTDVLHHVADVRPFVRDAERCLRPGGRILMIEPWVSAWSRFVYGRLHHEPFHPDAPHWSFPPGGPLSAANVALPWIVFARDRDLFAAEFPQLHLDEIRPLLPFRYVLSGGLALRSLMPGFTHAVWARLERALQPQMARLGMFAFVGVTKASRPEPC